MGQQQPLKVEALSLAMQDFSEAVGRREIATVESNAAFAVAYVALVEALSAGGFLDKMALSDRLRTIHREAPQGMDGESFRDVMGILRSGIEDGVGAM
jgi:hypothetical protein